MRHNRLVAALIIVAIAVMPLLALATTVRAGDGALLVTKPDYKDAGYKQTSAGMTAYFNDEEGSGWTCTKVDNKDATTQVPHDAVVVKNDQRFMVWWSAPAGTYTTGKGTSHWYYCDQDDNPPPKREVRPSARIIGPAGDPYFRYVLNNSRSDRPVTFRIEPWGRSITVGSGCIFRTGWHYELPFVRLEVRRGSGTVLAGRNSGPGGYYGPLYKGFVRGLDCG